MEYLPSTPGFSREQDPQVPADPEPQDMSVSCCHVAVIPRCSFPPLSADGVRCPPSISAVDTAPGTVKGGPPLSHEECWRSSQRSHNSLPQLLAYGYWGASHVGQRGSYPIGQCVSENLARKCSGPRALVSDRPARRRPHCRGVSVQSKCGDSPATMSRHETH